MGEVQNGIPASGAAEMVLFPFDSGSIPFSTGLRLHLVSGKTPYKEPAIVLQRGFPGRPDDASVRFYGAVIPVGNELRMWYQARGSLDQADDNELRVCYAVSSDGVHWEKPELGLVEYNGSKKNNIVELFGGRCVVWSTPVIYDPEDPDPNRRFKMVIESGALYGHRLAVAYSADGLRWRESPNNPVGPLVAHTGLVRFDGCYYVNGQDEMGYHGSHFGRARKLVTFASYDFERWTRASCLGFRRDDIPPRQTAPAPNMAAEVHRGAGLWDRGNVIIGIYDMVHGSRTGDPAEISMDLGLIVSNDALHYREPMPDFRLVPACGEPEVTLGRGPFIKRAQAICHVGDQTMCWYEAWHDGDIRLATWQRDRLGCFAVFREVPVAEDEYFPIARPQPHFISCPIPLQEGGSRLFINADGLSEHGPLKVEILDEQFRTLPGYAGDDCLPITESGLRQPVGWRGRETIEESDCRVRVKVIWGGLRPEDARLYAVYVG